MDVQLAITAEVVGQVLAVRRHGFELAAGQQGSAGKAAVGRLHADGLAGKGRGVQLGVAVYLISLGHVGSLPLFQSPKKSAKKPASFLLLFWREGLPGPGRVIA